MIKDKIEEGQTAIRHTNTEAMIVDPLRKSVSPKLFNVHVTSMGALSSFHILG